ncbi:MAG: DUF342 domain-containing protein [bacterium]|nr:DUF342 domain-containing protein [bacterium]
MTETTVLDTQEETITAPEYRLYVSRDRVAVLLDCPDPHDQVESLIERILADFKILEIPIFPDAQILQKILKSSCKPGQYLQENVIMMGQKPDPSQDGKLEWQQDYFAEGWAEDEESGTIDFWSKNERRGVKDQEVLVKLYHPVEGVAGLNVFGNEIPVTKPSKEKLRAGKNVTTVEEDGYVAYIATCDGRIRQQDGTVTVDDLYVIKGDVNLETGNIVHTGAVMIQGDVCGGASIEADGDVMVKGMIEPCNIKCGGNLTVVGGLLGDNKHKLEITGDLMAKYISEACIEIEGNVIVGNEIAHSNILCAGQIKVPNGRIAGGTNLAFKGIQVAEAGASGSSDTKLIAGIDHTLKKKVHELEEKILKMEEAQEKIEHALQVCSRKPTHTEEEIKTSDGLELQNNKIGQSLADTYMAIRNLKTQAKKIGVFEIIIKKELWSGTSIQLGNEQMVVKASVLKPRIILLRKKSIKILPLGEGNMPEE